MRSARSVALSLSVSLALAACLSLGAARPARADLLPPEVGLGWQAIGPPGGDVAALAVHRVGGLERVFAATRGGLFHAEAAAPRPRWARLAAFGECAPSVTALAAAPQRLWAAARECGVLMLDMAGPVPWSWRPVLSDELVLDVAVARGDPQVIVAVGSGVYRSVDAGRSWTVLRDTLPALLEAVAVSDDGTTVHVAGGTEVFTSDDGGTTWRRNRSGLGGAAVRDLALDRHRVWAATERGIYSRTARRRWRRDAGVVVNQSFENVHVAPDGTLWAGTAFSVRERRPDGAIRVHGFTNEIVVTAVAAGSDGSPVWIGASGGFGAGTHRRDQGEEWTMAVDGLTATSVGAVTCRRSGILAAVGDRVLRRDRRGRWEIPVEGMSGEDVDGTADLATRAGEIWAARGGDGIHYSTSRVSAMSRLGSFAAWSILPVPEATAVWAGGDAGAVYRSATGRPGTPWEAVRPLPPTVTQVVALAWGEDGTVWAGGFTGQGRGALYSSSDEGESWHQRLFLLRGMSGIVLPLPGFVVTADTTGTYASVDGGATFTRTADHAFELAGDPTSPGRVWAAGEHGVRRSDDGGLSWLELPALPTVAKVRDLSVQVEGGALLVGTDGGGILRFVDD